MHGEDWAGGGDQWRVRTALSRRYAHAEVERAYHALMKVVVESVDAVTVVTVRAHGRGGEWRR